MLKIYGNREIFYQWDLNQKLIVEDETVTEVHFCNRTDDCALVCEVYEDEGLHLVNVPNILLQDSWEIRAYTYCGDCYTKQETRFKVQARSKPADYIYTETEVKNYEEYVAKLAELDERVTELEKGGVDVDLTDYVKNTDYATDTKAGVVRAKSGYGLQCVDGMLYIIGATNPIIEQKQNAYMPINSKNLDYAVKTSVTTNKETLTEEEKAAAQDWLGVSEKLGDIQAAFDELHTYAQALVNGGTTV